MLQGIRDRAQGWIAWVIVILISIPFALWGVYEYLGGNPNAPVAEVNGTELAGGQFRQAYRRQRIRLQNLLGPNFDLAMLGENRLRRDTLNDLIEGEVLLQAGIGNGLRISDAQLADAIQSSPMFQEEGRFSEANYQRWLRMSGYTAAGFEREYRRSLLLEQIQRGIADTAFAGGEEVENILRLQRQKRRMSLLTLPVSRYLGNPVTEEAIGEYHERNRARFVTPERVSVRYLELSLDELPDAPEPSEETLRALYERQEAGREKIAREMTDGDAADDDAAPDTRRRSFQEARGELLEDYQRRQKEEAFFDAAEQLANLTFENPDTLAIAADTLDLAIGETGLFDRAGISDNEPDDEPGDEPGDEPDDEPDDADETSAPSPTDASSDKTPLIKERKFLNAAFSEEVLNAGNNSDPVELGEYRVVVLRRKEHLPASPQPLDAVRGEISARLDAARARERMVELGNGLLERLRGGEPLPAVAKDHDLTPGDAIEIERGDTGRAREVVNRVFRMPKPENGAIVYDGMVTGQGDFAVIALDAVIETEPADAALAEATANTLARAYGDDEYRAYIQTLRADAEIRVYEDNL